MSENTILIVTIALLLLTYWVLIWRINRLIFVIESTKKEFTGAKDFLGRIAKMLGGYKNVADGIVKRGLTIKLRSERLGAFELDIKPQGVKKKGAK